MSACSSVPGSRTAVKSRTNSPTSIAPSPPASRCREGNGDATTTPSALPASSTAFPTSTRRSSRPGGSVCWSGTDSCRIPAAKRSSRRITALRCLPRGSRSTTSSSSIRPTIATGARFRCSVFACIPNTNSSQTPPITPVADRVRSSPAEAPPRVRKQGGTYEASRNPDAETGPGTAAQHLGPRSADPRDRLHGADRLWRRAVARAVIHPRHRSGIARSGQSSALCVAHHAADAARNRLLDHLYVHLRGLGGQKPPRRDGADPAARYPAVGADPRLSDLHRGLLSESVPGPRIPRRTRLRVCDLHQPGLEHDLQHVPVAAQRPEGSGRGLAKLSPERLAALLAARCTVRDAGPDLEYDDVDVRRLVLRGGVGVDHRRQHHGHAAGRRLLRGDGDQGAEPRRDRLRHPDHVPGDPRL